MHKKAIIFLFLKHANLSNLQANLKYWCKVSEKKYIYSFCTMIFSSYLLNKLEHFRFVELIFFAWENLTWNQPYKIATNSNLQRLHQNCNKQQFVQITSNLELTFHLNYIFFSLEKLSKKELQLTINKTKCNPNQFILFNTTQAQTLAIYYFNYF